MADAPWRCSQCGTINEPVANSCRTCGRWPSLFDLEAGTLEAEEGAEPVAEVDPAEAPFEPEPFEVEPVDHPGDPPVEAHGEIPVDTAEQEEPERPTWQRLLTSAIVPLAFVVYILISIFFGDQG
jgi:hypothetical protein